MLPHPLTSRCLLSTAAGINKSSLDLVAPDEHVCDMWVRGLQHLVAVVRSLEQEKNYDRSVPCRGGESEVWGGVG